jgi:UDP-2,3-diacylglucosamine hydrolase
MHAWFASDIHIKQDSEPRAQQLVQFLQSLGSQRPATHLFLLGDIFDTWVGGSNYFAKRYQSVVDELVALKKRGIEIHYFEGNHDVYLSRFWQKQGILVHESGAMIRLEHWNLYLDHGDYINPEDKTYLQWLQIMRSDPLRFLATTLPGVFWAKLGEYASKKSRSHSSRKRIDLEDFLREKLRAYAKQMGQKYDFDFLITGHIHIQDDFTFTKASGRKVRSVNLGSWFQEAKVFYLDAVGGSWIDLNESAPR